MLYVDCIAKPADNILFRVWRVSRGYPALHVRNELLRGGVVAVLLRHGGAYYAAGAVVQRHQLNVVRKAAKQQLRHYAYAQPLLHHCYNGIVVLGGVFNVRLNPRHVQRAAGIVRAVFHY